MKYFFVSLCKMLPTKAFPWSHYTEISITVTSGGRATYQASRKAWQRSSYCTGFASIKDVKCYVEEVVARQVMPDSVRCTWGDPERSAVR